MGGLPSPHAPLAPLAGGSLAWRGPAEPYPWPSIPPDPLAPYSPAGQATRVLTAEVSSVIAFLASAKYMLVLGSKYSSFSRPA